jgi:hypothetical protein
MTSPKPLRPPSSRLEELTNEHLGVLILHHLLVRIAIGSSCCYSAVCEDEVTMLEIDGPEVELLCPNCYHEQCKIVGRHPSAKCYALVCPVCGTQFDVPEDDL